MCTSTPRGSGLPPRPPSLQDTCPPPCQHWALVPCLSHPSCAWGTHQLELFAVGQNRPFPPLSTATHSPCPSLLPVLPHAPPPPEVRGPLGHRGDASTSSVTVWETDTSHLATSEPAQWPPLCSCLLPGPAPGPWHVPPSAWKPIPTAQLTVLEAHPHSSAPLLQVSIHTSPLWRPLRPWPGTCGLSPLISLPGAGLVLPRYTP